jgi:iron complex transport system ATP-binding protein
VIHGKIILQSLHFEIKNKRITGIIGPNGAGKSSLLKCLFSQQKITEGNLYFYNKKINDYSKRERAQKMAFLLQEESLLLDMNVSDMVRLGLLPTRSLFSFSQAHDQKIIDNALKHMGLIHKKTLSFNCLSGGEKQRVRLARIMVQNSPIFLLDEPINHLDIHYQLDILHRIQLLNKTIIVVLHDLNIASAFCDDLILMDQGQIIVQGKSETVLSSENIQRVFKIKTVMDRDPFRPSQRLSFDYSKIDHLLCR